MAKEPVVTFWNVTTDTDITATGWDVGTVKADTESEVLHLRIWNSKGTQTTASNMQGCVVYVLDKNEAKSEKLVTEGWLQGKCTSASQGVFTALNNTNELQIAAAGMPAQEISGAVNNGDPSATTNFALCEFKFKIPANALHGQHAFYVVVKYYFV